MLLHIREIIEVQGEIHKNSINCSVPCSLGLLLLLFILVIFSVWFCFFFSLTFLNFKEVSLPFVFNFSFFFYFLTLFFPFCCFLLYTFSLFFHHHSFIPSWQQVIILLEAKYNSYFQIKNILNKFCLSKDCKIRLYSSCPFCMISLCCLILFVFSFVFFIFSSFNSTSLFLPFFHLIFLF